MYFSGLGLGLLMRRAATLEPAMHASMNEAKMNLRAEAEARLP
jgi:hypothetical protein